MALKYTAKPNNKHTRQILAAVVWILLCEPEQVHNHAKILTGFQQLPYSRWTCTSTTRATSDSQGYKKRPAVRVLPQRAQQQMPHHAGRLAAARMAKTGLAAINKEHKPDMGQSTAMAMWVLPTRQPRGGLYEAFVGCWKTLNHAPQTPQDVQSMGQKCSSLAYTAIWTLKLKCVTMKYKYW